MGIFNHHSVMRALLVIQQGALIVTRAGEVDIAVLRQCKGELLMAPLYVFDEIPPHAIMPIFWCTECRHQVDLHYIFGELSFVPHLSPVCLLICRKIQYAFTRYCILCILCTTPICCKVNWSRFRSKRTPRFILCKYRQVICWDTLALPFSWS